MPHTGIIVHPNVPTVCAINFMTANINVRMNQPLNGNISVTESCIHHLSHTDNSPCVYHVVLGIWVLTAADTLLFPAPFV